MTLILLIVGAVLVVAAIRNSQGALFSALQTDVPGFVVWAAAILALGALGFVPGLKPVSRGLLALVLVVIVLKNAKGVLADFQGLWQNPGAGSGSSGGGVSVNDQTASAAGALFSGVTGSWGP